MRGFGVGIVSETELAASPNIRILQIRNAQMYTKAYIVCLTERRDRSLINAYFQTAASIDPKSRGTASLLTWDPLQQKSL